MKTCFFLALFVLLLPAAIPAQAPQSTPVQSGNNILDYAYFGLGLRFGSGGTGPTAGGSMVFRPLGLGFGLSFDPQYQEAPNTPRDYESINLLGDGGDGPGVYFKQTAVLFIKSFPTQNPKTRVSLEAGPVFNSFNEYTFTKADPNCLFCFSNYTYLEKKRKNTGVMGRVRLQLPLGRVVGLEFGLTGNFNGARNLITFDTRMMLGKLRERLSFY